VLQNHVLFRIAEEPPAEMASLLRLFQTSVPAIVKRRAKELLNVIKEAVKRGLNLTKQAGSVQSVEDQEEIVVSLNEVPTKEVTMLETEMKSLETADESGSTSLWGSGMIPPSFVIFSLRADGMIGPESRMAFSTSQSSLFGPSESLRSSASGSTLFASSASTLFGAVNVGLTQIQVRQYLIGPPGIELKTSPTVGVIGWLTFVDFFGRQTSPQ
jgi:exosome complex exonuclease RRP6